MEDGKSRTWAVLNKPSNKLVCADRAVVQYREAAGGGRHPDSGADTLAATNWGTLPSKQGQVWFIDLISQLCRQILLDDPYAEAKTIAKEEILDIFVTQR